MSLRLVSESECPDCISEVVFLDGVTHQGRPGAVLGHRGTCPTLRAVQRDKAAQTPYRRHKKGRRR